MAVFEHSMNRREGSRGFGPRRTMHSWYRPVIALAILAMACQPSTERSEGRDPPGSSTATASTMEVTSFPAPTTATAEPAPSTTAAQQALSTTSTARSEEPTDTATGSERSAAPTLSSDELDPPLCSETDFPRDERDAVTQVEEAPIDIPEWQRPKPVSDGIRTVAAEYVALADDQDGALQVTITVPSGQPTVHVLPLGATAELHPSLHQWSRTERIVLSPDRWLIPVTMWTNLEDLHVLIRRHPAIEGRDARINYLGTSPRMHPQSGEDGVMVAGSIGLSADAAEQFECFIPWEESGTTEELWYRYGQYQMSNKPRFGLEQLSGYIWTGRWGEEPVRAELTDNRGECCWIDVLDKGFVAISSIVTSEYSFATSAPLVHYSADGIEWDAVVLPTYVYGFHEVFESAEVPIWVCSVQSTDTGLLIRQAAEAPGSSWPFTPGCGEGTYWSADKDWTNWRRLLAPPPGYG